jgi:xanthine/uracil permease
VGDLGRILVVTGAVILVAGLILMALGRVNLPIGRLPGDIVYRGKNTTVYFPVATSILLSVVVSLVVYLLNRFRH